MKNRLELAADFNPNPIDRPKIVTLCGSIRFYKTFTEASLKETLEGRMVFSIGAATNTDEVHFAHLEELEWLRRKDQLDTLHYWKVLFADEILVLNVGGYIGESTHAEMVIAKRFNKPIRYWEPVRTCRICGCTDLLACVNRCYWVDTDRCSNCV